MDSQTTAIIVAGGRSQRFGQDKRRLRLWGEHGPTLLEHTVELAALVCSECVVVLNDAENWRQLPARLVPDAFPGTGPLGGIASGFAATRSEYALVLACDMPNLDQASLTAMLTFPRPYQALVPRHPGAHNRLNAEPLHAVYHRSCSAAALALIHSQSYALTSMLTKVDTTFVTPQQLGINDPAVFCNINEQKDVKAIRE